MPDTKGSRFTYHPGPAARLGRADHQRLRGVWVGAERLGAGRFKLHDHRTRASGANGRGREA
eukprot:1093246-Rhodomonas_salina.1